LGNPNPGRKIEVNKRGGEVGKEDGISSSNT
jgi:hypothetical protein